MNFYFSLLSQYLCIYICQVPTAELSGSDCAESYDLSLGAVGATFAGEAEGTFVKVCQDSDGWPIYKLFNGSYYLHFIPGTSSSFWAISEKIGSSADITLNILKVVEVAGNCPGPESSSGIILINSVCYPIFSRF